MRELIENLRAAGVRLELTARGVEFDGPKSALTAEVLERLKANRAELLEILQAEAARDDEEGEPGKCPWCGPVRLLEGPSGLWCLRCERLAWVFLERSIVRADYLDVDIEGERWTERKAEAAPGKKGSKRDAINRGSGELF
jgi:hypothetical protein